MADFDAGTYRPAGGHPSGEPDVSSISGGSGAGGLEGSGSPEGSVTADAGATYWDSTNQALYVKDSGTGNTGWKAVIV